MLFLADMTCLLQVGFRVSFGRFWSRALPAGHGRAGAFSNGSAELALLLALSWCVAGALNASA
ncbi:hypothetical protein OAM37_03790, partial [bacterium]|nr:hypothetical protein [bacterium]